MTSFYGFARALGYSFLLACSAVTHASTLDCNDLYVGRIWVEKGQGLKAVVFLNHPNDGSGSYWSYFEGWTADERKEALTLLTAAKAMRHRVNVTTEDPSGCTIQLKSTVVKSLYLTTNP
jgi:hypothetical protein